ncbi:ArsA family ATPase [Oscillatoria sp. CS-180]|uniref:Get3/ArsA fold putative tail anchor-mediating ATPase NosAFP n=1 Tax=Oscillatoria sp. CS-180 TaxID=3021720 RepID=UPI00232FB133|nr:ArsA family ATPase [Oscillatoria sp. CS-180]MDB9529862.1 ArsA family ATPase [Oscillatoria sp. CS-180]
MPQILTFLGQSRSACAVASVAFARQLAQQGTRVLWVTQDSGPLPNRLWNNSLSTEVQSVGTNLSVLQLQSAVLLEKSWDIVKALEAQYLRDPLLKQVFGQELVLLPGMDDALTLDAIRTLYDSQAYDCIVFDGLSGKAILRMWGLPEQMDWYVRRFQKVLAESELARTLSPFIQPVAGAVLNISGSQESINQPVQQARSFLDAGRMVVQSADHLLGFLVTTDGPADAETTRYLWGSSQQIGLTVGGAIAYGPSSADWSEQTFSPLPLSPMPALSGDDWTPLVDAVPSLTAATQNAPAPVVVNELEKQVKLFLPGFTKADVNLTQYGPEVTVTAGDQRRNLFLPSALKNRSVQGAKFQDDYLILSF